MHTESDIWRSVSASVGFPVQKSWKRFCAAHGLVDPVLKARNGPERDAELGYLLSTVRRMDQSGIGDPQPAHRVAGPVIEDGRWALLGDLFRAGHERFGIPAVPEWAPITAHLPEYDIDAGAAFGTSKRIDFSIDDRVPLSTFIAWLRRLWPGLRRAGLVRRTRPFADRTVALVRFVCLEAEPDLSWRGRWEAWNERHSGEWSFPDRRAFTTAFQRAERQLSGSRFGLAHFYDPAARLRAFDPDEFLRRVRSGDRDAIRIYRRDGPPHSMPEYEVEDRTVGQWPTPETEAEDGEARTQ